MSMLARTQIFCFEGEGREGGSVRGRKVLSGKSRWGRRGRREERKKRFV
jgi:hypothetical protein